MARFLGLVFQGRLGNLLGRHSFRIFEADVRAFVEEELHHVLVALQARLVQRCPTPIRLAVDVRVVLLDELPNLVELKVLGVVEERMLQSLERRCTEHCRRRSVQPEQPLALVRRGVGILELFVHCLLPVGDFFLACNDIFHIREERVRKVSRKALARGGQLHAFLQTAEFLLLNACQSATVRVRPGPFQVGKLDHVVVRGLASSASSSSSAAASSAASASTSTVSNSTFSAATATSALASISAATVTTTSAAAASAAAERSGSAPIDPSVGGHTRLLLWRIRRRIRRRRVRELGSSCGRLGSSCGRLGSLGLCLLGRRAPIAPSGGHARLLAWRIRRRSIARARRRGRLRRLQMLQPSTTSLAHDSIAAGRSTRRISREPLADGLPRCKREVLMDEQLDNIGAERLVNLQQPLA